MAGRNYKRRGGGQYAKTITVHVKPTTFRRNGKIIHRRGYTYKRKDLGKPGKGPKLIDIKEKGALTKFGYAIKKSPQARRRALRKAIRKYGALSVYRKLMAQYVFRKNYAPDQAAKFKSDAEWVRNQYKVDGFIS